MRGVLGQAGNTRIYATDGTGRDTYINFNNGGNTAPTFPALAAKSGAFGRSASNFAPGGVARGGESSASPAKRLHYHVNGTGRDTYIHSNHGGFISNYAGKQDYDSYVDNLRGYQTNNSNMRDIYKRSTKQGRSSPQKDFFVEGQLGVRSPKVRNGLAVLKSYQSGQCARLSMPRQKSSETLDVAGNNYGSRKSLMKGFEAQRTSQNFLRKSG